MRKIAIAGAVAALMFAAGCQDRTTAQDVQDERADVLEQREQLSQTRVEEQQALQQELPEVKQENQQELAELKQENQQEIAELKQGTQEEIQAEREELAQERQDLAETRSQRQEDLAQMNQEGEAVGGAGAAGAATSLSGTIESKKADKLTLKTDQGSKELIVTPDTDFVHLGRDIQIQEVPQGAQVRASYSMQANKMVADRVEVIDPSKK